MKLGTGNKKGRFCYCTKKKKRPYFTFLFLAAAHAAGFSDFFDDTRNDEAGKRYEDDFVIRDRQDIKCSCQKQDQPDAPQNRGDNTCAFIVHLFSLLFYT